MTEDEYREALNSVTAAIMQMTLENGGEPWVLVIMQRDQFQVASNIEDNDKIKALVHMWMHHSSPNPHHARTLTVNPEKQ